MNEKQMQDMAVSILLDEYTQLDVAQLLKEYEEDEENGELPNVPDSLDERCAKMIRREFAKKNQKKYVTRFSKMMARVAMAALMLIGLCTVSILSVEAWREPVLRFVLETFDRRSSVSMEGETSKGSKTPEEIIEKLTGIVLPDYKIAYKYNQEGHYIVRYVEAGGGLINLTVSAYRHGVYFDTEMIDGTPMQINGHEVVFVNKNGDRVIWLDEDKNLLFDLRANDLNETDFWNIVYSLIE